MPDDHEGGEGGEVFVRRGVRQHVADAEVELAACLGLDEVSLAQHPQEPVHQRRGCHFRNLRNKGAGK